MSENLTRPTLYLVSDVHSFFDSLIRALTKAGFFEDKDAKLVLLGDALDRGSQPLELIDFLFKLKDEDRLIYILGNHEELLYDLVKTAPTKAFEERLDNFIKNGVLATALRLANMYYDEDKSSHMYYDRVDPRYLDECDALMYPEELASRVKESKYYRELFMSAVDFYETEHYVFCHGWIPVYMEGTLQNPKYFYNPNWRDASYREWRAARWLNGMDVGARHYVTDHEKTVVCGHVYTSWGHQKLHGNDDTITEPFVDYGIIAIDAGTYKSDTAETKKINCVVINGSGEAIFDGEVIHAPELYGK